ncbi:MAG: antibiotic biosynthesis monooxygenase [Pseudomonadota bacterium]
MARVALAGYIIVPPRDLDAVIKELPNHISLTKSEPGCLSFDVIQSTENPLRFDVSELFESQLAFEEHQTRVQSSYWGEVTRRVERHYKITKA